MSITLILHEATRTGAPRVGGLIAKELARDEDVNVLVLKDGPLVPWLKELIGDDRITVCNSDEFEHTLPFEERLRSASEALAGCESDVVYVNSLAASVFVLAAKAQHRKTVLHVHERSAEMFSLLRHDVTKMEVMAVTDGVVLAANDLTSDILDVFGLIPAASHNFGIAIEIDTLRETARAEVEPARTAGGGVLSKGERLLVGMCGHASPRKGSDIFFETAEAMPDCDFVWIGGWEPAEAIENTVYDAYMSKQLENLYVTGAVDNPYAHIGQLDLFFLSSREDPNPLVLAEAMALHVPLLTFSKTTAVADRLGRTGILCHGLPNVPDVSRVLKACAPGKVRSESFRHLADEALAEFDIKEKMKDVRSLVARVRGVEA